MAAPVEGTVAGRIYRRWRPLHNGDAAAGYPLGSLAESIALPLDAVDLLARESDTHPAWGLLWDATNAPLWVLPWIALNVGVEWRSATSETLRTTILDLPNFKGGLQSAQIAAAKLTLTGAKRVTVTEPYLGDFWQQLYVTYVAETPDPVATERAIVSRKAAGKVLTYRNDPGWSVGAFEAFYSAGTVATAEAAFADINANETRLP